MCECGESYLLVPLPEELQPLEPEPDPEEPVPKDPDPEEPVPKDPDPEEPVPKEPEPEPAEPVPERESSWRSRSRRSLEVDMASWLDSLVSP